MSPSPRDTLIVADNQDNWELDTWATYPPELVISLGDLCVGEMRELRAALPTTPILGVLGNHDWERANLSDISAENLTGSDTAAAATGQLLGSRYLAAAGCVRYKDDPEDVLYTQDEYAAAIGKLDTAHLDLLVTHCPPAGVNDDPAPAVHQGIAALDPIVRSTRPRYVLHGHTHPEPHEVVTEYPGSPDTEVIYVYGSERRVLVL